jgi:hypothetical protein
MRLLVFTYILTKCTIKEANNTNNNKPSFLLIEINPTRYFLSTSIWFYFK